MFRKIKLNFLCKKDYGCENLVNDKPIKKYEHKMSTSSLKLSIDDKIFAFKYLRWCSITHWEYDRPSSNQIHVFENSFWINQDLDESKNSDILKGLYVYLKNGKVFLVNYSESSVYWIKPSLDINLEKFKAKKLDINHQVQIFNFKKSNEQNVYLESNVINLSFGRHWGSDNSKRPSIEYCSHWINLSFNTNF
ncbi:unnamed protein product [Brachionus calyciflorus]|uniref:MH2 domain-containing protein n=1 Tax=Brachionus calyciflorus TaxID=104777 RepID=A0A813RWY4_9BILA|nr:unnamed protein product [Brachionus calyciflorus]